jgi:hypothetical protein
LKSLKRNSRPLRRRPACPGFIDRSQLRSEWRILE